MRVIIKDNYEEMSKAAAQLVKNRILNKNNLILGLATGSSPIGLYKELIKMCEKKEISFKKMKTFNLDEYYELNPDHPQSYRYFMNINLFDYIDINKKETYVPDGLAKDVDKFCSDYEKKIKSEDGIDLQVIGIGGDGHIGFNEPGTSLASRTHLVILDEQTIKDNARFFNSIDEVPKSAITMGVGTVLDTKEILLVANGIKKAKIVAQALEGPITSMVTCSAIQLHPKVTVFLDKEAASELKRLSYYNFVEKQLANMNISL
ncbi:MAG: glucosamine-6-phosphate deaminase [Candidatus Omnitrophica bacterium]|jgi:glucosamine-6-phosphate deaminase|nr:glucosamine-6-phosphate deaminase [Candidatus Omnitrophota bacterium]